LASNVGGTSETIADVDDLFASDISISDLASRIAAAVEESETETEADRLARRTTQLARFAKGTHQAATTRTLERLHRQAAAHG